MHSIIGAISMDALCIFGCGCAGVPNQFVHLFMLLWIIYVGLALMCDSTVSGVRIVLLLLILVMAGKGVENSEYVFLSCCLCSGVYRCYLFHSYSHCVFFFVCGVYVAERG